MTKKEEVLRDKIAIEFMNTILASPERFEDYADEEDLMAGISRDAYEMADKMIESKNG